MTKRSPWSRSASAIVLVSSLATCLYRRRNVSVFIPVGYLLTASAKRLISLSTDAVGAGAGVEACVATGVLGKGAGVCVSAGFGTGFAGANFSPVFSNASL